jgi:peptide/nickel transport system substrate-binding protein
MMKWFWQSAAAILMVAGSAAAQTPKSGGIMKIYQRDSPASASIHEEATFSNNVPFMGVFNNLVLFRQDMPVNTPETIAPELADSWAWSADKKTLTFKLHPGVKWHDGKPFTSADVKCTMDLLQNKSADKFRKNPRRSWYANVEAVVPNGDLEVAFKLGRPQLSLLSMLASGYSPMYPCHVSTRDMRTNPVGTGPFKFVEFKQNEIIRLAKNPDYWRKGKPYLDGIDFPIITNRATAMLAFIAGKVDMTMPTEVTQAILRDIKSQAPKAVCKMVPTNVHINLIVNREKPPFDNADLRRAMALTIDRRAFIDILFEGDADMGGALLPGPEGIWGMPKEMLAALPGYSPDVAASRTAARALMVKAGYGPDKHLAIKVSTRNIPTYRDPAVILLDQLKEIYVDATLDIVETSVWFGKIERKDYAVGLNLTGNAVDDPDQAFYENYGCGSERNVTGYCNPELQKAFDAQSVETDVAKRREMVWAIDSQLQNDIARPVIVHQRAGTCWSPDVHGYTQMINSSYNGFRFEDMWLDR